MINANGTRIASSSPTNEDDCAGAAAVVGAAAQAGQAQRQPLRTMAGRRLGAGIGMGGLGDGGSAGAAYRSHVAARSGSPCEYMRSRG